MTQAKDILVVAPHPDDETLGCGGTLLRRQAEGDRIHWMIVTRMDEDSFPVARREARDKEIEAVSREFDFASVHQLGLDTTRLDTLPMGEIVGRMSKVFQEVKPHEVFVPYRGDVHTDHKYVFDAAIACTKWFRYPSVRRVLVYEALSETEMGLNPDANAFRPNVFVDISDYLERKLEIMALFAGEILEFPFPRSKPAVRALAMLRGSTAGVTAAEAFMLLREIV